jgi:4'-phosphopantetheinyl transferase
MRNLLQLGGHHIDVWLAWYQDMTDPGLLANLEAPLSQEERRQAQRFHFADDRIRYRVTRAMVRTVLSRYAPLAPAEWAFSANAYGRPGIANDEEAARGLCFNVSHTRGLVALAVCRGRALGVDVENVPAREVSTGIADHFFSPVEVAELSRVPPGRRQDRFFEYWTFKEAYIKARGMGLSIPLDQFSFHFPHKSGVHMTVDPALGDDAGRWRFWQYRPTPDHLLALCAERLDGAPPEVTLRLTIPTLAEFALELPLQRRSDEVVIAPAA